MGTVPGLGVRLRQYRKHRQWNQGKLAEALQTSQANVSRLESDKQDLSGDLLRSIIELDDEWFGDLAGGSPKLPHGCRLVPMAGAVAAGVWRPIPDSQEPASEIAVYGLLGMFPGAQAVTVEGPSMDKVFPHGTILVTASPDEFVDAGYEIASDLYVVAHRVNNSGDYEATVKQLVIDEENNHYLWPRSNHPEHQQPIKIGAPDEWETSHGEFSQLQAGHVYIAGVVVMEQRVVLPASVQ